MIRTQWCIAGLVIILIGGCREDVVDPVSYQLTDHIVRFEVPLPPHGENEDYSKIDSPVILDEPISRFKSISLSVNGSAEAAIVACGNCENDPDAPRREVSVPNLLHVTIESNDRVFSYRWQQTQDGTFVLENEQLECSLFCDLFFADGIGRVNVTYGTDRSLARNICAFFGEEDPDIEGCVLKPGSFELNGPLEFTINYQKVTRVGAEN